MLKRSLTVLAGLVILFQFSSLYSGNHEIIHPTKGYSIGWENSTQIPYWTDRGALGLLSNDQAKALTSKMIEVWESVETANVGFAYQGDLSEDVTEENIADYLSATSCGKSDNPDIPEDVVPIIYDEDGKIIEYLTGMGSSGELGGLASLRCFTGTVSDPKAIFQGMVIINGKFIDGKSDDEGSPEDLAINNVAGVLLHELGHLIGLDHSVVNDEIFDDIMDGARPDSDSKYLPVMLPTVLRKSNSSTMLHPDDINALSTLYPAGDYMSQTGNITGEVTDAAGTEIRKVNVIARRIDDPLCEAVSVLSGRRCVNLVDARGVPNFNSTTCLSENLYGDYLIEGLTPGQYSVEVEELSSGWIRSGMYPSSLNEDLPGDAEFYNFRDDIDEDPFKFTPVNVTANETAYRIHFVLSDTVSSPDQLDRIPLDDFTAGPGTRCKNDEIDFTALMENPELGLVSLSTTTDAAEVGSAAAAGCQLNANANPNLFGGLIFVIFTILLSMRNRLWKRN